MKRTILVILSMLLVSSCALLKKPRKSVLQNEGGKLELRASVNRDTIRQSDIEKLRVFLTLKNHYPFTVRSVRYLSFCSCTVFRNGYYFYTVEKNFNDQRKTLNALWYETFPPDTAITMMVYVDIKKVCQNKGIPTPGRYTFQGDYENQFISDGEKYPIWIGRLKTNKVSIIVP